MKAPKIVFGPVSSRRFGRSLGIDLSPAKKQCNFDCVYCELAPARPVVEQDEVVSVEEIIAEVGQAISRGAEFDFLTLTANGEPSLYPQLAQLITALRELAPGKKLLILSNGTAVLDPAKFTALLGLDVVKFSLDAALQKSFLRVDRARRGMSVEELVAKMAAFRQAFAGELVLEILVVEGMNDGPEDLAALNAAVEKIAPARVDLSSIDRPPAYPVRAVSEERLAQLATLITAAPVLIPTRQTPTGPRLDLDEGELVKLLALRPQSQLEVEGRFSEATRAALARLVSQGLVRRVELAGVGFFRAFDKEDFLNIIHPSIPD